MLRAWFSLTLASLFAVVSALDLKGRVQWNELCNGIDDLGYAKVVLDSGKVYYGGVTRDGSFVIPNVRPGTYVLSVTAHDHTFDRFRVDVPTDDASASLAEVRPYIPGTPLSPASPVLLPYPITLTPRRVNDYFAPPQSFNIMGMLKNPMVMMMLPLGALMLGMPYLMKHLDPEIVQEFNQHQAKIAGIQSSVQSGDIKSGLTQLLAGGSEEPKAPDVGSNVRQRGNRNKKR